MSSASPILLDNTVLSNFALTRSTDLVFGLWPSRVLTTPAVLAEHQAGIASGILPADLWSGLRAAELSLEEEALLAKLPERLGIGERSCLAVALGRNGALASDDLDARKIANEMGVAVTGSVGILLACVSKEFLRLSDANRRLADMIARGYHSPAERLEDLW